MVQMSTSDIIRTVGSGATILVALTTLVWFIANLDGRVKRLEEQVHTLALAPVITDASKTATPTPTRSPDLPVALSGSVPNPIAETCSKLALEVTEAFKASRPSTVAEPIQELMRKLGCISK
jgi:hypothetical protein